MSDPVWLADVLRAAGLNCDIYPGAFNRGHGDFGGIWGVVCHHTGANGASAASIAQHPTLGLASQLHLDQSGKFTLCGVGIAWHAGRGSWPGIARDNANQVTIGIEAANDGGGRPGLPHRSSWPDAQYNSYVTGVAAILNHLGDDSSRAIGHKEWAGAEQGKWDPGAIDMNIFRADVAAAQERLRHPAPVRNAIDDEAAVAAAWIGGRLHDGERACADGVGRYADFEHGSIYWHPHVREGQATAVPARVYETWAERKWEQGPLGYPILRHTVIPDAGDIQAFQGGTIYRRYGQPGYVVHGVIGDRWAAEGFERGSLGWPASAEQPHGADGAGRIQQFEHGALVWHPSGAVELTAE